MKIAFFEVKEGEKEYINSANWQPADNIKVDFFSEKLSIENAHVAKDCDIISVFVESQITKEILDKLPDLKMIATRSTGFDHISLQECDKKNIVICNVPHYGDSSVAEYVFAVLLNLSRKLYESITRVKSGDFTFGGLTGFDLHGKTMGIIGMGDIGQNVARIAGGFGMNVLGFDIQQNKKLAKQLKFTYVDFEQLLKDSNVITLHVPYNQHTRHLINAGNISLIKKGAYLINTSRGGIIETQALVKALQDGTLAGAGLDVLEEENFIREEAQILSKEFSENYDLKIALQDHILMEQKNVIITPHNAFNSKEALEKILETTIMNVQSFIKGKPTNLVSSL